MSGTVDAEQQADLQDITGCFGRHEVAQKYLRHRLRVRELAIFEKTLQKAVGPPGKDTSAATSVPAELFFLLTGKERACISGGVIGYNKPGQMPFVVFKSFTSENVRRLKSIAPIVLHEFYLKALELVRQDWSGRSQDKLLAAVDAIPEARLEQDIDYVYENMVEFFSELTIADYWENLDGAPGQAGRERWMANLLATLEMVVAEKPADSGIGILIPVPAGEFLWPFVSFFVQLAESRLKHTYWRANVFWYETGPSSAELVMFFSPLSAAALSQLLRQVFDDETLVNISKSSRMPAEPGAASRELARKDGTSLMDVLFRCAG